MSAEPIYEIPDLAKLVHMAAIELGECFGKVVGSDEFLDASAGSGVLRPCSRFKGLERRAVVLVDEDSAFERSRQRL